MALMPGGMVVTLGFLIFYLCRNNTGFFVFGIAYAFRYKHSSKARLLVVVAIVPLAVTGGVLRLWIIFTSAYYIGPVMAEHRPHVLLSWSVLTVLLVAAIGVDRYVSRSRGSWN